MPELDFDDEPAARDHLALDPDAFDTRPTPADLAPFRAIMKEDSRYGDQ